MKYVYWLALVVVVMISTFLGYRFANAPPAEGEPVLVVNGRAFSRDEFDRRLAASTHPARDVKGFADELVTRELMIQEARRLQIDREEGFRRSLQNFYEQSLVKTLMDRKYRSTRIAVTDEECRRYVAMAGHTLRFTILPAPPEAPKGAETRTVVFEELSGPMRCRLADLDPGEQTEPFSLGGERVVVRLEEVTGGPSNGAGLDAAAARKLLTEDARERAMDEWLSGLRQKASVRFNLAEAQ